MKIKLLAALFTITLLSGCVSIARPRQTPEAMPQDFSRLQMEIPGVNAGNADIRIVEIKSPVKLGEDGRLVIQGQPGLVYYASSTYMIRGRTITSMENRTAAADGKATWSWRVRADTTPGTYVVTVTGGGRTAHVNYTVTQ